MIIRLLLAGLMGGIIGLERESHGRPAGCAHIIVSLGSCLIMLVSIYGLKMPATGIRRAWLPR